MLHLSWWICFLSCWKRSSDQMISKSLSCLKILRQRTLDFKSKEQDLRLRSDTKMLSKSGKSLPAWVSVSLFTNEDFSPDASDSFQVWFQSSFTETSQRPDTQEEYNTCILTVGSSSLSMLTPPKRAEYEVNLEGIQPCNYSHYVDKD